MNRGYKIGEFARLASVTVKTLHHYDRVGLLKPERVRSGARGPGARVYSVKDLERLEQISALKFLGISLKEIKYLLGSSSTLTLLDSLDFQLKALEEKRKSIGSAMRAIELATKAIRSGDATDASVLAKILEVMDMQPQENFMRKYYTEQAWLDRAKIATETPLEVREERSRTFKQLFAELEAAVDLDPASEAVQALTQRWMLLTDAGFGSNAGVREGAMTAWKDHENWPPDQQDTILKWYGLETSDRATAMHRAERVFGLIGKAIGHRIKTNWRALYGLQP
jgi:DNA-binding transcriptional MerR regulator